MLITGLLWAGAWFVACTGILTLTWLFTGGPSFGLVLKDIVAAASLLGIVGGLNGLAFAGVFMLAERHHALDHLSMRRVALWGASGGALFPAATYLLTLVIPNVHILGITLTHTSFGTALTGMALGGAFGAAIAATHLSIARRVPSTASRVQLPGGAAT